MTLSLNFTCTTTDASQTAIASIMEQLVQLLDADT